jgi:hypothetical protein
MKHAAAVTAFAEAFDPRQILFVLPATPDQRVDTPFSGPLDDVLQIVPLESIRPQ